MTEKVLDLKETLYELTSKHEEIIPILKSLGFAAITNSIARNTFGRKMTIPAGCEKMGISLRKVIETLEQHGYKVKQ